MDGQHVLFEFMWVKWTIPLIATAIAGTIGAIATLYKLIERWLTREQRRLDMLHTYIDKEEKNITGKRPQVFVGIQQAQHSLLAEKNFDVGAEIDEAITLLDAGKPHGQRAALPNSRENLRPMPLSSNVARPTCANTKPAFKYFLLRLPMPTTTPTSALATYGMRFKTTSMTLTRSSTKASCCSTSVS